jgi:hypothetical protein
LCLLIVQMSAVLFICSSQFGWPKIGFNFSFLFRLSQFNRSARITTNGITYSNILFWTNDFIFNRKIVLFFCNYFESL